MRFLIPFLSADCRISFFLEFFFSQFCDSAVIGAFLVQGLIVGMALIPQYGLSD